MNNPRKWRSIALDFSRLNNPRKRLTLHNLLRCCTRGKGALLKIVYNISFFRVFRAAIPQRGHSRELAFYPRRLPHELCLSHGGCLTCPLHPLGAQTARRCLESKSMPWRPRSRGVGERHFDAAGPRHLLRRRAHPRHKARERQRSAPSAFQNRWRARRLERTA